MKKIIFTDNLDFVRKCAGPDGSSVHLLNVDITRETQLIYRWILEHGMESRLVREKSWVERDLIGRDYAEALDLLTEDNRSFDWWAYNFVSKSPIATKLFDRVAWSIVILNFVLKGGMKGNETLIVLTNDFELYHQAKSILKDSCEVIFKAARNVRLLDIVKKVFALAPVLFFLKSLFRKIIAEFLFTEKMRRSHPYNHIFLSLLNQQSFSGERGGYNDFYFSPLIEYLSKDGRRCLNVVLVWPPYVQNLIRLKRRYPASHGVLPLECFLGLGDLVKVSGKALQRAVLGKNMKGDFCVQGYSFLTLLKRHKRVEETSMSFSLNMSLFYIGQNIAKRFREARVIYPFENRAFERMLIKGIKGISAKIKLFGYQHAALTKRHLNYYLGKSERQYMPLPDRIITSGEVPKSILGEFFEHSSGRLVSGSSLRANPLPIVRHFERACIKNILVVISTDLDEYKRVLLFLDALLRKGSFPYNIYIRPHPVIPLSLAVEELPGLSFEPNVQGDNVALDKALNDADLVLFASSTVSVEALSCGLPVIYLDVSPFLNNNPLGFLESACEKVSSPEELMEILERMKNADTLERDAVEAYAQGYLRQRDESLFEKILEKT